ncbi:MFS transporter [Saccharopolyspora hirsuta]|uniref:MFS transporter n=1 Tax=Saccharopolyspora hirsuta TaxID=1837 RepID=A0A5M7BBR9_SACHI|nr:MFS transporter [Saccharopolyspora hirsuta]
MALTLIVSCELMLMLDTTILNVALPSIKTGLGFSEAGLAWVVNAFALAFGGLLLLGGRAGDIMGRRSAFMVGTAVFTAASLLGGVAQSAEWLIAARVLQGVGAALAGPSTLALLVTHFEEGPRRNRALGVYSTVTGSGMALGLLLGGVLTASASWRWVLLVNIPIGLAVILLTPRYLEQSEKQSGRFDVIGALTSTLGMTGLVYGFIRAADSWTDPITLVSFAVGIALLAVFLFNEAKAKQPIMPLRLFASRNRTGSYLAMLLVPATLFGMFFFLTQFLQQVQGLSPLLSGLAFLPMAASLFIAAQVVSKVLPALGPKITALIGMSAVALAIGWLSLLSPDSAYLTAMFGPMVLFGAGVGFTVVPLNMVIMSEVPAEDTGAASGALQAFQQVGGSLGLAVLIPIFAAAAQATRDAPPAGLATEQLQLHVQTAGTNAAFAAGAIFSLAALVVLLVTIRTKPSEPAGA